MSILYRAALEPKPYRALEMLCAALAIEPKANPDFANGPWKAESVLTRMFELLDWLKAQASIECEPGYPHPYDPTPLDWSKHIDYTEGHRREKARERDRRAGRGHTWDGGWLVAESDLEGL